MKKKTFGFYINRIDWKLTCNKVRIYNSIILWSIVLCPCCFPKASAWWVFKSLDISSSDLLTLPLGISFAGIFLCLQKFHWFFCLRDAILVKCIRVGSIWDVAHFLERQNYNLIWCEENVRPFPLISFSDFSFTIYDVCCILFRTKYICRTKALSF